MLKVFAVYFINKSEFETIISESAVQKTNEKSLVSLMLAAPSIKESMNEQKSIQSAKNPPFFKIITEIIKSKIMRNDRRQMINFDLSLKKTAKFTPKQESKNIDKIVLQPQFSLQPAKAKMAKEMSVKMQMKFEL